MASSMANIFLKISKTFYSIYSPYCIAVRHSSKLIKPVPKKGTIKHRNLIKSSCESLAARGFLRSIKPYTPPENVGEKVMTICQSVLGKNCSSSQSFSREEKFLILNKCFEELNYSVPNSLLYKINTMKEVVDFYKTPISTTVPLDDFKNQDLPPNLHIQYDYLRFDSDTDTKFKGITVFPKSSTLVTGLKYKDKYKGNVQDSPYEDVSAHFDKEM